MAIKLPNNELHRLETLFKLKILNTEKEEVYDNIINLACSILNAPMAAISLVAEERQWAKSIRGGAKLPTGEEVTSVAREDSFASIAILTPDEPLIIMDTLLDERSINNPNVTGMPFVRFMLAVPLVSGGDAIGALCVADTIPREMPTSFQVDSIKALSKIAMAQLELREFIINFYDELKKVNISPTLPIDNINLGKFVETYRILNNKCDVILDKLKARKENKAS